MDGERAAGRGAVTPIRGIPAHAPRAEWGTAQDQGLHVVLVAPEIPPNTGSIARLCAATGAHLHLVEPLGFALDDRHLKRAGLDYWPSVGLTVHADFSEVEALFPADRLHLFSSHGQAAHTGVCYARGSVLVFGCESRGLPPEVVARHAERLRRIPLRSGRVRSLNLANAVSVALYEALRQWDFEFPEGLDSTSG